MKRIGFILFDFIESLFKGNGVRESAKRARFYNEKD